MKTLPKKLAQFVSLFIALISICVTFQTARAASFTTVAPLTSPREGHTATILPNGKVLVAGGNPNATAELYDPTTGTWTPTLPMASPRRDHTATLLPNGKVLIVGGHNNNILL